MIGRLIRAIRSRIDRATLESHRQTILRCIQGGEGLYLNGKILLVHGQNLSLGKNVHIGHDSSLNCRGGISIGDHTILSGNVTIYSYDHGFKGACRLPYDKSVTHKPVRIGQYVWIGMNVTIAPGTVIEDGVVVGIGAVVSGHIPANAIVVSPKPRIVGYRDSERTRELYEQGMFYQRAA
ncbi:MAG: acyltransferase [Planctomycetes bacterium]|nr:acyltransferase [Planctomycetota bacterium]